MGITSVKYRIYSRDISSVRVLAVVVDYGVSEDVSHCEKDLDAAAAKLLSGKDVCIVFKEGADSEMNRAVARALNGGELPDAWKF